MMNARFKRPGENKRMNDEPLVVALVCQRDKEDKARGREDRLSNKSIIALSPN